MWMEGRATEHPNSNTVRLGWKSAHIARKVWMLVPCLDVPFVLRLTLSVSLSLVNAYDVSDLRDE